MTSAEASATPRRRPEVALRRTLALLALALPACRGCACRPIEVEVKEPPPHLEVVAPGPGLAPGYLPVLPLEAPPVGLSLAAGPGGQPLLAWASFPPAADGGEVPGQLSFAAFDPAAGAWRRPRVPVVVGDTRGLARPLALVSDPGTGALGLAFTSHGPDGLHVFFGLSADQGVGWTTSQLSAEGAQARAWDPALAMAARQVHVAYRTGRSAEHRHGEETDPVAAWPAPESGGDCTSAPELALDAAGVAHFACEIGPGVQRAWRAGSSEVEVARGPGVLASGGLLPALAPDGGAAPTHLVGLGPRGAWCWSGQAAEPIPGLGFGGRAVVARSAGGRVAVAVEGDGRLAAACAGPDLAWAPCGPGASAAPVTGLALAFAGEKLLLAGYLAPGGKQPGGAYVWREP